MLLILHWIIIFFTYLFGSVLSTIHLEKQFWKIPVRTFAEYW